MDYILMPEFSCSYSTAALNQSQLCFRGILRPNAFIIQLWDKNIKTITAKIMRNQIQKSVSNWQKWLNTDW